jgi:acetylornithine/succinyldiaminopimelate/putrescine aminotransferase
MGRTGKLFAFEHSQSIPDIITLAKSLGGGLPIGAMISSKKIMSDFTNNPMLGHITTFGGNPLSCAAASAVIDIIQEKGFLNDIESKGKLFKDLLKHKEILEIRQIGLMLAVDLENEEKLSRLIELCRNNGIIIYRFLSHPYSFRISPPLTISKHEITIACEIILNNLDKI